MRLVMFHKIVNNEIDMKLPSYIMKQTKATSMNVRKHLDWIFENCAVEGCGFKTTSSRVILNAASFHLLATGPLTRQTLICQST